MAAWAALVYGWCVLAPPAQDAGRTARLLPALFAGLRVEPEGWGRPRPIRVTEPFPVADGEAFLHYYVPALGRYPAIIFSLGVNPAPPDDPRVVRLLSGFARAGIVAVLVQSTALDQDRITPAAPDLLVRAFAHVAGRAFVDGERVALTGFSVGAGVVSVAAADARIAERVRLLEAFGGYYSFAELAEEITTASLRIGDGYQTWDPDALSRAVMEKNLIAAVPDPAQREAVALALAGDLARVSTLGSHARTVYDLLANTDPTKAGALYARLPESQRAELRALSPAASAQGIRAPTFLMHDRGDPLIPYVETRRFAETLTAQGTVPYYVEFDIFEHVDPTRGGNPLVVARDMVKLFLHIQAVLRELE